MDHVTQLMVAAQAGDRDALERFIRNTQADVWKLCRYLGDAGDTDDLVQETYERAIGSLHRFRAEGTAKSWLLTIARHVCADNARRAQRRRRRDARAVNDERAGGGVGTVISDDDAGRIALDDLLTQLPTERRQAFVLTQVLGLSYGEAAEVIGCPIGTVRSRVARARLDLVAMDGEDSLDVPGTDPPPRATSTG